MKKFLSVFYIVLILAFVYVPILVLVVYSFTDATIIGNWNGFSFELYKRLFTEDRIRNMIINTVLLAVGAAVLSTVLGTVGAIGLYYSKNKFGKMIKGASNISVINAEIVTAISLALLFSLIAVGKSYFSLIVAHMVICTPFVILSVIPKLKQMDTNMYEAALDLGATPSQALFKVVLPEILPGVLSGFLLAITLSLDDYIVTAFTKPETFDTISTYVYNAVKNQAKSELPTFRALSAVIFLIVVIVVVVMNIKASKKEKEAVR